MSDPAATRRLAVGRIDRAHGLRGELVVTLTTNRLERLDPGAVLYTDDEVLTVESAQPHLGRFIVRFVDVDDRADADRLHGALVPLHFAIELTANERVDVDTPEGLFDESLRGPGRKGK